MWYFVVALFVLKKNLIIKEDINGGKSGKTSYYLYRIIDYIHANEHLKCKYRSKFV